MEEIVSKIDIYNICNQDLLKDIYSPFVKYSYYDDKYLNNGSYSNFKLKKRKYCIYNNFMEVEIIQKESFLYDDYTLLQIEKSKNEIISVKYINTDYFDIIRQLITQYMEIVQNDLLKYLEVKRKQNEMLAINRKVFNDEKQWILDYEKALGVL